MDETGEILAQYKQYHPHHHRLLPRFKDHAIILDTEKRTLFILTWATLILTIQTMLSTMRDKARKIKTK